MRKQNYKKEKMKVKNNKIPIANNQTAAWADIEETDPISRVPRPSLESVIKAKEWVDEVQK